MSENVSVHFVPSEGTEIVSERNLGSVIAQTTNKKLPNVKLTENQYEQENIFPVSSM